MNCTKVQAQHVSRPQAELQSHSAISACTVCNAACAFGHTRDSDAPACLQNKRSAVRRETFRILSQLRAIDAVTVTKHEPQEQPPACPASRRAYKPFSCQHKLPARRVITGCKSMRL